MEDMTHTASPHGGGLLERLLDEIEGTPPSSEATEGEQAMTAPTDTPRSAENGTPLASLLTNPAVLSALPSLMENLSPLLASMGRGVGSAPTATHPHGIDRHTALLCALKPYLSPHRRETAETVIRLCKVWDALEKSGISLTGLLGTMGGSVPTQEGRSEHVQ